MADRKFAHLHLHTHYSLLDGFNRIPELVKRTKELGMTACAITDHGNLYGAIEFYTECRKGGINPVIGYEAYLAPGDRREKGGGKQKEAYTHLTLLAKNATGFRNLIKLSSIAFLEGYYYNPRIDRAALEAHAEGLICLSGCLAGEFNQYLLKDQPKEAEKLAKWFHRVFKDDFYIEIQNNGITLQDYCTPAAADIAHKLGVPLVATADAHYLCADDAIAHDVLFCINTRRMHDPRKKAYPEERMPNPYYVRSPDDMYRLFPDHPDAVARSQEIADAVDIQLDFKKRHFPVFRAPEGRSADEYLRQLCVEGLDRRYPEAMRPKALARLDHELAIISKMGYSAYFLIVWDFVRYAREQGIPCTARGSGCGAIVAYTLFLSHVCPLEYDLLFERFLDPNRTEPPDIDIDFCQDRRERVIQYVKEKYGHDSVAQIGTFGTLAAKAALKDVGRVLGIPLEKVNAMCKLVPMKGAISLDLKDALEVPDFRREYDNDPTVRHWVDIARKLEGMNRNTGTHAAGVVIANGPITDYVPVQRAVRKGDDQEASEGEDGRTGDVVVTTQWEMGIIEKVGMLKMDFLGLRNLTVLDDTVKLIKKTRGHDIDPLTFPLDDPETYRLLQRGDAKGVFQLESDGIRELLKQMKPDTIRDLIAVLALYRPGPLQGGMVDSYINRKHGREKWDYPHPVLKEILDETYGVMCIHEDARVAMADGTEKPIRLVRRGDRVHSLNLDTRRIEVKDCHGCGPTRRGDGLRVILENGFSVVLTPDHNVRTWDGWVEAQDLRPGEHLVAIGVNTPQEFPSVAGLAPWLGADEDVAYLLGFLTGDGCLTGSGITVATGTEVNHRRLVEWLSDRLPSLRRTEYFHTRSWYVTLSHPDLLNDPAHGNRKTRFHHLVEQHGLKSKATGKRVPEAVFRSPAPVRAAYLAGLIDSDGCLAVNNRGLGVAFISTASRGLCEDLRRLLQFEGIPLKLYPQRVQVWGVARLREVVEPYLVLKSFPDACPTGAAAGWVPRAEVLAAVPAGESIRAFAARTGIQRRGLAHPFPFVKSSTAAKAGIDLGDVRFVRVAAVEPVPDQQFYGMSVADHHNLLANGVVVKNCYQEQIMRILNRLGGIELSKAYAVIKAISKKISEKIEAARSDFLTGAQDRGVSAEVAEDIFEKIVFFAGYGFNKCLSGDSKITDAVSGEVVAVGDLYRSRRPFAVHALGDDGKLVVRPVTDVVWNGRRTVFRLRTRLGKTITGTANHPFRTFDGWTHLGNLKPGNRIAVPRRLTIQEGETWPRHEIIALAGLLSEGNTCHPSTLYFYGNDRALVDDFADAIGQFPDTVARVYARGDDRRLEVQANTGIDRRFKPGPDRGRIATAAPPARSGAFRWAERLGILGKKATEKRVPAGVFRLCDADLELFLGRLWAGDGFLANATLKVPFYATSSRGLAEDVQHLLLRLGIVSRIHDKQFQYRGEVRPGYTVHVLGDGGVETFLDRVAPHCLGREKAVERMREYVGAVARGRSSKDTIPTEVRRWVDEDRQRLGLTWTALEAASGLSMQEFCGTPSATKTGFRRATIARLAAVLGSDRLAAVADSDVFWDRVVSVEPAGVEDTFDLTVDVDHNFVADGLVVHNSHTAAYAQIGYQTAYLKAHYPAEFMAALLSSEIDDGNKRTVMVDHIADARKLGVEVEPPNVNKGSPDFDVVNGKIVFGLTAIKGLGRGAAEEIVRAREAGGRFKDLFDFCERVDLRTVPRAAIERLIKAGAMDGLGQGRRAAMLLALPRAAQAAEDRAADKRRGQKSFLDLFAADAGNGDGHPGRHDEGLPDVPEWPELDRLKYEKEALDFYISSHPLAQFDEQLGRFRTHTAAEILRLEHGSPVTVGGMVSELILKTTKQGKRFAILRVEDFTGTAKCVLWSEKFGLYKDDLGEDKILLFEGRAEWRDGAGEPDVIVERVMTLERAKKDLTRALVLRIRYGEDDDHLRKLDGLAAVLRRSRGPCPVYLTVRDPAGRAAQMKLASDYWVNPAALPVDELEMLLGPGSVLFTGR